MKVFNQESNALLDQCGHYPVLGTYTGSIRILGGVIGFAVNIILAIGKLFEALFVALSNDPKKMDRFKYAFKHYLKDAFCDSITHVFRGIIEIVPVVGGLVTLGYDSYRKREIFSNSSQHPYSPINEEKTSYWYLPPKEEDIQLPPLSTVVKMIDSNKKELLHRDIVYEKTILKQFSHYLDVGHEYEELKQKTTSDAIRKREKVSFEVGGKSYTAYAFDFDAAIIHTAAFKWIPAKVRSIQNHEEGTLSASLIS